MASVERVLSQVLGGTRDADIRLGDLRRVLAHLGFDERIKGSDRIFARDGVREILNVQEKGTKAKPYQVKQVRDVIVRNRLAPDAE